MSEGPIAGAYVEIGPKVDEAKFDAAINKVLGRIDEGFAKIGSSSKKMASQTKGSADEAATGLKKIENQTTRNINAIKKFENSSKGMEGTFRRIATRITEAFSIYAVARFVQKSVEVAEAYNRTTRVVEQAIKTTGGAAGVSIERFNALAASMSISTGIAETTIRTANMQLLAFTKVRDVVGKGNDIFSRAGKAIQDISVRTGLGAVQIARSLGKALEDPAKASLVLRRASVILTDQQTNQIKVFEKSGNVLAAQKVILDAVGQKFGGAAKAASDPLKQLNAAVNQIERGLGEALLPTIEEFAMAIVRHLPQIKEFANQIGEKLHAALDAVTPALKIAAKVIEDVGKSISNAFKDHPGLQTLAKYALIAAAAFKILKEALKAVLEVEILVKFVTLILEGEFAAAFGVLLSPVALVIAAIAGLAAGFIYLYRNVKPFHDAVNRLATTVKEKVVAAFTVMWSYFKQNILPTLIQIGSILEKVVIAEFKIFVAYIRYFIIPEIKTMWSIFKLLVLPQLKEVGRVASTVFKAIPDILNNYVIPAVRMLASVVLDVFGAIVHGAADAFSWIPGIGPKLQGAAKDFDDFRKAVNASLAGINTDKTIVIHVIEGAPGSSLYNSQVPQQAQINAGKAAAAAEAKKRAAAAAAAALAPFGSPPTGGDGGGGTGTAAKPKGPANLAELVRSIANALNDGLKKGSEAASKTVSALEAKIKSALSGTFQEGLTSKAVAFIEKQRTALVGLAGAYFKVSQQTDALKKKVDTLTKAATDFKNSVISALEQTSNLDAFLNQSGSNGVGSVDKGPLAQASYTGIAVGLGSASGQAKGLVNFLADQVRQLTSFQSNLNTLISRIGDTVFVQELAGKGLASADLVASLAAAPASALTQINRLQSQVLTIQHNIANAAGKKLQDSADKANALLKQSVTTQDKMLVEIKALSHNIVAGLARLLGTKVPKFAEGGIHNRPTLGWLGEDGREVTIPLTRPSRARSLMDQTGLTDLARARGPVGQSGPVYNASFNLVPQGDPAIHAQQVAARLGAMVTR